MGEATTPKKRGFKFWKKNKRVKKKNVLSQSTASETISDTNSSLSKTQSCIPTLPQGSLNETTLLKTPERDKISSQQNNNTNNATFNNVEQNITNYHDAKTSPLKNATYPEKINSVSISSPPPPPPLPPYKNTAPRQVITEERKRMCLARLHTIAKTHGVCSHLDNPSNTPTSHNHNQQRDVNDVTGSLIPVTEKASKGNESLNNPSKENESLDEPSKYNESQDNHRHKVYTSPKSVMGDLSNQIVTIWNESNISDVLSCASDVNLIHDDVKEDLCFCPDVDYGRGSFDGDIRIYERYMDMKRRSRLVGEGDDDSDSDSDEQGSYSGRILTVTSRKNMSRKRELRRGADTKNENGLDTYSSNGIFNSSETIDERLDVLVDNVLGGSDDDSLDKMMKQLDLDKAKSAHIHRNHLEKNHNDMNISSGAQKRSICKSSSIASNYSHKNHNDMNMPNRAQNSSNAWDKCSNVYEDAPDDEKVFQLQSSRRNKVEDNSIPGLHGSVETAVEKYDPFRIVRTASEESF